MANSAWSTLGGNRKTLDRRAALRVVLIAQRVRTSRDGGRDRGPGWRRAGTDPAHPAVARRR